MRRSCMNQRALSQVKNEEMRSSSEVSPQGAQKTHVQSAPLLSSHGNFFTPSGDTVSLFLIGVKRSR